MTTFEKLKKLMAIRYARRQKFNKELDEIKYGKEGRRKMPTGKKLTIFLIGNFTLVELYTLYIMYAFQDISALPTLITVVVGEVVALMVYMVKSLKENTASTGFVYELKMKDAENGIVPDDAVG
jgi:hypothetical protein